MQYLDFLKTKQHKILDCGVNIDRNLIHPKLFEWQKDIVTWAVKKGRCAIFLDTGLGKTFISLQWSKLLNQNTLIIAPLSVARQTVREAHKIDLEVKYVRNQSEITDEHKIWITNYEMIEQFDFSKFGAVVLDESSILKSLGGKTKQKLIDLCEPVKYKLCCTATPAPNDYIELGNHTEFLGICKQSEMLATFFINANKEHTIIIEDKVYRKKGSNKGGTEWRIKHHAEQKFFEWLASWAITMTKPSDIGYDDNGFVLPPLNINPVFINSEYKPDDQLFFTNLHGITDRTKVRRSTLDGKLDELSNIINKHDGQWIVWCGLDAESKAVKDMLGEKAVEVKGSDSLEHKLHSIEDFQDGKIPILVTKGKIAGFGLNMQNACNMAFLGMNDCYDEKTEILTKSGWLHFNELDYNDDIATVNPNTQMLEWQKPRRIINEQYNGKMLHFIGQRNFDLLVTPNHKIYTKRCNLRFPNGDSTWKLKYAQDIFSKWRRQEYRMMSVPQGFSGDNCDRIKIPINHDHRVNSRSKIFNDISTDKFMELSAWYITEGYCRPLNSKESGRICISQSIDSVNYSKILDLLASLNIKCNSKTKDITFYSKQLAEFLINQFGDNSDNKHLPIWVKNLDCKYLRILRDTMLMGDGCHEYTGGKARFYRTNSKQLADDFQEICLKTGVKASVKIRKYGNRLGKPLFYDVLLGWEHLYPSISTKPIEVDYNGFIGCVEVDNHIVIVRRNGIPIISGNSWELYYQCVRREWRYGQDKPVNVYLILHEVETEIYQNIMRKDAMAKRLISNLIYQVKDFEKGELGINKTMCCRYNPSIVMLIPDWLVNVDK